MPALLRRGMPSAGLYAGPVAWMVSTQANYSLVPWECAHQVRVVAILGFSLALVSLAGGFLSWRAWSMASRAPASAEGQGGQPRRFLALIGMAMALLFAIVIALHGTAGLVFHGCER